MTTGTNRDVDPAARRRAADLLGVSEDASCVEARRAYFGKLPEWDFVPPLSSHQALRVLEGKGVSAELEGQWLREDEDRLRADVESFAAEFFALPVARRRERWEALVSRCQGVSPLAARLEDLMAGLEVEVANLPSGESFQGRLVEHFLQSFPLSPLARATARQSFLRQVERSSAEHLSWEKAARYLLAEWPALASLDGESLQHIAKLRKRLARRSKMHRRNKAQPQATPAQSGNGTPWWILFVVLGMVGGAIRGFKTSNDSPSTRVPSSSYTNPLDGMVVPGFQNQPPVRDLFDPSKFDVEIVDPTGVRLLRFTPRLRSTTNEPNGLRANEGQPLMFGEAALRLMGGSKEQVNALFARAAVGSRPDGTPKTPPGEVGPKPPKSPQDGKTRP